MIFKAVNGGGGAVRWKPERAVSDGKKNPMQLTVEMRKGMLHDALKVLTRGVK